MSGQSEQARGAPQVAEPAIERTLDADFAKYAASGAYHWREIGGHWIHHHAFTAERYRRTLAALGPLTGLRVLDYGCGDGALLGQICRAVGSEGEAHGLDVSADALRLAEHMLGHHRLAATLHAQPEEMADNHFDAIVCAEVIEHVHDVGGLLDHLHRCLKPGGKAVVTTPIRLSEEPEDHNHVQEWFPRQFAAMLADGPLELLHHEEIIPVAAVEAYFWRPPLFLRVPVFRLICNLLSIYGKVNALSWLKVRPRLFMTQLAVLQKPRLQKTGTGAAVAAP